MTHTKIVTKETIISSYNSKRSLKTRNNWINYWRAFHLFELTKKMRSREHLDPLETNHEIPLLLRLLYLPSLNQSRSSVNLRWNFLIIQSNKCQTRNNATLTQTKRKHIKFKMAVKLCLQKILNLWLTTCKISPCNKLNCSLLLMI